MNETLQIVICLVIPFLGTTLGSAMVFLMKNKINKKIQKLLLGFAAGVMMAASVWSLLIPSIDMSKEQGKIQWLPAAMGFLLGIGFLLLLDSLTPHLHMSSKKPEGLKAKLKNETMLVLAVTLHNIPEGMAVGVVLAAVASGNVRFNNYISNSIGTWNSNSEFPRRSNNINAIKNRRKNKDKGFLRWNAIRDSRTNSSNNYNITYRIDYANITIFTSICSRSNGICSCRRINTRSIRRRT